MKQLFIVVWLLSALPLAAQQVVSVSSGEHDGFTRLVLSISPDVNWEVVESRGEVHVRFPDQALSFSTAKVFDRISHDRITDLSENHADNGSDLQLDLPCSCAVQSFAFNGNYIVIDVYDGPKLPPVDTAKIDTADVTPPWQPDTLPYIQASHGPVRFTADVMATPPMQPQILPDPPPLDKPSPTPAMAPPSEADHPVVAASADQTNVVADVEAMAGAAVSDMNTEVNAEDNPEMRARIEEAQKQLLAQLTRAADQGLVNFVPDPAKTVTVEPVASEPPPPPAPEPPVVDPLLMQQLSARTAYGNGTEGALSEIVNQFAMPQCKDDSYFLMAGWGGEGGFSSQLATLRSALLGEFDVPDPKIAEQIVQLYLRYGLGAEARLMLRETDVKIEKAPLYNDMAALLEGDPAQVTGPILQGTGCGGAHEMWYLATGLGSYKVLEPLTITDAFSAYPIEVRSLIGPPLAQAFIDRGQVDAAHVVLEIVRRAESGVTTAQQMAEAKVMEAQGDLESASNIYRELAKGNSENAPDALVAYALTLLAGENPVPASLLVDLEASAFLNRNTDHADPLRLSEIRVRNAVEGADKALAQVSENLQTRPQIADRLRALAAEIFQGATAADLGDYPYAQMVLKYTDMLAQGPEGDAARVKISEEMASIGLPEIALDVLAPNLNRANADTQHAEAAAYLQLYQPAEALAVLEGDNGLEAYKLKLSANLQLEDYTAVAAMLNDPHAKEISVNDVALRAGDWAKIQEAGAVGTLASYVRGGDGPQPDTTLAPMVASDVPSLQGTRDLLANNQESMKFLEGVLAQGATPQP